MNEPVDEGGRAKVTASRKRLKVAAMMAVLIALFYLLREHWSHVSGMWPYLLLLACPVMHLFHGHGHQDHSGHGRRDDKSAQP